jgi:hypothetical protein
VEGGVCMRCEYGVRMEGWGEQMCEGVKAWRL